MKFKCLLFVVLDIFLSLKQGLLAQDTTFLVQAGSKINDVIPAKDQFQYACFPNGKVFFRDGSVSETKLNYNRLMDEMHFISLEGDTLAINNEPTIKFICIDNDTFYFEQGFIMVAKSTNLIKLAVKHGFRVMDKQRGAGFDMMSSTSSVASLSSFDNGKLSHNLTVNEQAVITKFVAYYFADKYNRFVLATKESLRNLFPSCWGQLEEFCKSNKIDFGKRNDLERVVDFLNIVAVSRE